MTFPDKKTDLFVKLLSALEGSRGSINWTDIAIGASKQVERKKQEAVAALVGSLSLQDALLVEEIAQREVTAERSKRLVEVVSEQAPSSANGKGKKRRPG